MRGAELRPEAGSRQRAARIPLPARLGGHPSHGHWAPHGGAGDSDDAPPLQGAQPWLRPRDEPTEVLGGGTTPAGGARSAEP